ncbi:DUF262 domain-containing protein [Natrinema longum]|uniref:DUF262 domain-containing protein n=1 Tax=Natrinema longum TaxID=370324 RepID=UPI001CCDC55E|nr:DUF262 domain-containing protein [Natrinema longum]MBZ6497151.1 DUF262 domain-containing HNH endonuclease family protein [Natrinema longum]
MMETLEDFVSKLNKRAFLPGLQREFVWKEEQIAMLFDSFIRGYPVGQVTLWDIDSAEDNFATYEFIRKYIDGDGRVPRRVRDRDARRYNKRVAVEDIICDYLVIDGQQRLNSAYVGLCGSLFTYSGGSAGSRADERFWSEKVLCINLLGSPEYRDADGLGLAGNYEFEFRGTDTLDPESEIGYEKTSLNDDDIHRLWFPVHEFVTEGGAERETSTVDQEVEQQIENLELSATGSQRRALHRVAQRVVTKFRQNVLGYELPSTTVKYSSQEVHTIFSRINLAGESPQPYQYTQSLLATYCPYTEEDAFHPREKLKSHIETLSDRHPAFETEITRQFLTRCLIYLINEDLLQTTVEAFSKDDEVKAMRNKWIAPDDMGNPHGRFETAIDRGFQTVGNVGLAPKSMPSILLVALLAKFYYENPDAEVNEANERAAFRFVAKSQLLNALTGSQARSMAQSLSDLRPEDGFETFPGDPLLDDLDLHLTAEHVDKAVENARYDNGASDGDTFTHKGVAAILGLLDEGHADLDIERLSVDHIYPKACADDIPPAGPDSDGVKIHRIGNLQLLDAAENRRKGDTLPEEWLNGLGEAEADHYRTVNRYPESITPTLENFQEFVERREAAMKEALKEKYAVSAVEP